jgi:uncharacterized protein YpmS
MSLIWLKFSRYLLRSLAVLLLSAPIIVLLISLQTGATVGLKPELTNLEISQVQQLLLESAPRNPNSPSIQHVILAREQLDILLRYSIELVDISTPLAARVSLAQENLTIQVSAHLNDTFISLYLNLRAEFQQVDEQLDLQALYVGKLKLPVGLLRYFRQQIQDQYLADNPYYQDFSELLSNIQSVNLSQRLVDVELQWEPALLSRIGDHAQQLFISEQDRFRIMRHYQVLSSVAEQIPASRRAVSLTEFLNPLFTAASENSANGSDPIAENRTLLQTLAIYVNNEDIQQLLGELSDSDLTPARYIEVRLLRRQDLAQHLVSIAAITASAGAELAELLSTTKEAYDARYRSGFSFSDLTANIVGVALASLATRDAETAILMQERMSNLQSETDYMPEGGSNRDGLSESDFNAIFQDRNSIEYQQRLQEIEVQVYSRPLFSIF